MTRPRSLKLAPLIAAIALASCGTGDPATNQSKGEAAVEHATLSTLTLTSEAFRDGHPIPSRFTCDGANETPTLHWTDPPPGTRSFALVVDDPDAPNGTFRHWGVYNIPVTARSIGAAQHVGAEVHNDFGKVGYGGPCPPKGHGPHHYHFKLFALDTDRLDLGPDAKVADVEKAAAQHALGEGEIVGIYERQ